MKASKYIGKAPNGEYYINISKLIFVNEIKSLSAEELIEKYEITKEELKSITKHLNKHGFSIDKRRDHELLISEKNIKKLYSLGMSRKNLATINNISYKSICRIVKEVEVVENKPNLMKASLLRLMTTQIKQWLEEGMTHKSISERLFVDRSTVSNYIRSLNLSK